MLDLTQNIAVRLSPDDREILLYLTCPQVYLALDIGDFRQNEAPYLTSRFLQFGQEVIEPPLHIFFGVFKSFPCVDDENAVPVLSEQFKLGCHRSAVIVKVSFFLPSMEHSVVSLDIFNLCKFTLKHFRYLNSFITFAPPVTTATLCLNISFALKSFVIYIAPICTKIFLGRVFHKT